MVMKLYLIHTFIDCCLEKLAFLIYCKIWDLSSKAYMDILSRQMDGKGLMN